MGVDVNGDGRSFDLDWEIGKEDAKVDVMVSL